MDGGRGSGHGAGRAQALLRAKHRVLQCPLPAITRVPQPRQPQCLLRQKVSSKSTCLWCVCVGAGAGARTGHGCPGQFGCGFSDDLLTLTVSLGAWKVCTVVTCWNRLRQTRTKALRKFGLQPVLGLGSTSRVRGARAVSVTGQQQNTLVVLRY